MNKISTKQLENNQNNLVIKNKNQIVKNEQNKKVKLSNYLGKYKFGIFMYVLVYVVACACNIFMTIILARAVEQITTAIYQSAMISLAIVCGLYIARRICWYLSGIIYNKYANAIMADLNIDLANHAFKLCSKTFADNDTGMFVQRIVYDPERIINNLANVVDLVTEIISSLIMVIYIGCLNVYIGLALLGIIIVCSIIEYFRTKFLKKARKDVRKKGDKISSITTEIVRSEKDIKSLGLESSLGKISKKYYRAYTDSNAHLETVNMTFYSSRNFIIEVCSVLLLILGVYFIDIGLITLATFMLLYSNNDYIRALIWDFGEILTLFTDIKVSCERIFSLFDEKLFPCEKFGTRKVENVKGAIEFKNVEYSFVEYDNPYNDEDSVVVKKKGERKERKILSVNKIFDNLSFKIEPNTTVAFVGRSGSGKSTILNLMSKMYDADGGQVLIDGIDIKEFDKESLRNSISLVNQFPYIFDMTIRENLMLAKNDATEEELNSAIARASLKEFIDTLPKKLDTKVGESGIKLSGGQKQRLAIARALLRNSPIIIFDESTSSLDNFAQEDIKHSIDNLKGKSTIVIVAHRLSTIRNVDKIFFLDEGKIEDIGTFDELFENNVKFKNMFFAENIG